MEEAVPAEEAGTLALESLIMASLADEADAQGGKEHRGNP